MLCACSETKGLAFPIMEHYISFALKQQATGHQCKVLEGQSYIYFHFLKESQIQNVLPALKD